MQIYKRKRMVNTEWEYKRRRRGRVDVYRRKRGLGN